MSVPRKILVCFLLSSFLFAGIAVLAFTGIFDLIESRFYNPAVTEMLVRETAVDAKKLSDQLFGLQNRFSSLLHNSAVCRSFLPEQASDDIYERSRLFELLHQSVFGLHSVRFIDSDGKRIHFSTYSPDIIKSDSAPIIYRDYYDAPVFLSQERATLTLDTAGNKIIFSFPFFDSSDVCRGVALFSVFAESLAGTLAAAGRHEVNLYITPAGIVNGFSKMSTNEVVDIVSAIWIGGYGDIIPFVSSDMPLVLVSAPMESGFYYGRVVNNAVLIFSQPVKILMLVAVFLTLFLIIFFCFNLRQEPEIHVLAGTGEKNHEVLDDAREVPLLHKTSHEREELEELEAVEDFELIEDLELVEDSLEQKKSSNVQLVFGNDDIPYLVESSGLELVDGDLDEIARLIENAEPAETEAVVEDAELEELEVVSPFSSMVSLLDGNTESSDEAIAELEDISTESIGSISMFRKPFAFSLGNPELLQGAGNQVIYEQNGIHYISDNIDNDIERELNSDFVKLIKSVVNVNAKAQEAQL